jgi:hypothetical protein
LFVWLEWNGECDVKQQGEDDQKALLSIQKTDMAASEELNENGKIKERKESHAYIRREVTTTIINKAYKSISLTHSLIHWQTSLR